MAQPKKKTKTDTFMSSSSTALATRPVGHVTIPFNAHLTFAGTGGMTCREQPPDYVPPDPTNVALWIDASQGTGDLPRHDGDDAMMDVDGPAGGGAPRAPGTAAFHIAARPVLTTQALLLPSSQQQQQQQTLAAAAGTALAGGTGSYALTRRNGRTLITLSDAAEAVGLAGTWGPLGASWTLCVVLCAERGVGDYAGIPGLGRAMPVLSSPLAGVTVHLPAGGAVPPEATAAEGGPLDGVPAGAPWDAAFVGRQLRQLLVVNDAAQDRRSVYVDGFLVATEAASQTSVPAGAALAVGAGCPLAVAEVLVWAGASASVVGDVLALRAAQRAKWGVRALPPTLTAVQAAAQAVQSEAAQLAAPTAVLTSTAVPLPDGCWLDAAAPGALWADVEGTASPAAPNGAVRRWRDRSGQGRDLTFPAPAGGGSGSTGAQWTTSALQTTNRLPVVSLQGVAGTFAPTAAAAPLAGTAATGFTVVAVWRPSSGSLGGHPLGSPEAVLEVGAWTETLGVELPRVMPAPSALLLPGTSCLGCWQRAAGNGVVSWRLGALVEDGGYGGYACVGVPTDDGPANTWPSRVVQVGATGRTLQLCELLVWRSELSRAHRQALQAVLVAKWGLTLASGPTTLAPAPFPLGTYYAAPLPSGLPVPGGCWLDATQPQTLCSDAAGTLSTSPGGGGVVRLWRDRSGQNRHLTLDAASGATWETAGTAGAVNGLPVVSLASGPGLFPSTPLGADCVSSGFTAVAVWRVQLATGAHPLGASSAAFNGTAWHESLAPGAFSSRRGRGKRRGQCPAFWCGHGTHRPACTGRSRPGGHHHGCGAPRLLAAHPLGCRDLAAADAAGQRLCGVRLERQRGQRRDHRLAHPTPAGGRNRENAPALRGARVAYHPGRLAAPLPADLPGHEMGTAHNAGRQPGAEPGAPRRRTAAEGAGDSSGCERCRHPFHGCGRHDPRHTRCVSGRRGPAEQGVPGGCPGRLLRWHQNVQPWPAQRQGSPEHRVLRRKLSASRHRPDAGVCVDRACKAGLLCNGG